MIKDDELENPKDNNQKQQWSKGLLDHAMSKDTTPSSNGWRCIPKSKKQKQIGFNPPPPPLLQYKTI